jgi:hypothetical protein
MKFKPTLALALMFYICSAQADNANNSCMVRSCAPGQHVVVRTSKDDPVAQCPTNALSTFANFVIGLAAMRSQMGVPSPADPDDLLASQQGDTAILIQKFKSDAGVSSAKEAFAACQLGKDGVKATVLEVDQQSLQAKISPQNSDVPIWLPSAHIDKL